MSKSRGFAAPCLWCGECLTLSVDLRNVTTVQCSECDKGRSVGEIRQQLETIQKEWLALLAWLETAPERAPPGS